MQVVAVSVCVQCVKIFYSVLVVCHLLYVWVGKFGVGFATVILPVLGKVGCDYSCCFCFSGICCDLSMCEGEDFVRKFCELPIIIH